VYFGFDTMEKALVAKSKFDAIKRHVDVWTEFEEHERLRRYWKRSRRRPTNVPPMMLEMAAVPCTGAIIHTFKIT
jgi:hypothetical protein